MEVRLLTDDELAARDRPVNDRVKAFKDHGTEFVRRTNLTPATGPEPDVEVGEDHATFHVVRRSPYAESKGREREVTQRMIQRIREHIVAAFRERAPGAIKYDGTAPTDEEIIEIAERMAIEATQRAYRGLGHERPSEVGSLWRP